MKTVSIKKRLCGATCLFAAGLLVFFSGLSSCRENENEQPVKETVLTENGIILYSEPATDGCGWTISIDAAEYAPVELPSAYSVSGLHVKIDYTVLSTFRRCGWEYQIPQIKIHKISITD
jgi:hypothetical protein